MTPGDRALLNQHVRAIRRLLDLQGHASMQLSLNINEHTVQSYDYKLHERITVDEAARVMPS